MTNPLNHFSPGDIVSASAFNIMVDTINDALLRLQALEAGTSVGNGLAITQLIPAGPFRIGDTLQILGQSFQFAAGAARVFFNATQVLSLLPTSTDSRLEFVIPTVPGVVETGSTVDLVVLNADAVGDASGRAAPASEPVARHRDHRMAERDADDRGARAAGLVRLPRYLWNKQRRDLGVERGHRRRDERHGVEQPAAHP